MTYRWFAHHDKNGMASALIRNQDLDLWGITKDQLMKDAKANTKESFSAPAPAYGGVISSDGCGRRAVCPDQ